MAELERPNPDERAYRDALLADEAGRAQRHARLMAALPPPPTQEVQLVSNRQLAWRASPWVWGLMGLAALAVVGGLLVSRQRHIEPIPGPGPTPQWAAAERSAPQPAAASAERPVVLAEASPKAAPKPTLAMPPPPVAATRAEPAPARQAAKPAVQVAMADQAREAVTEPPREVAAASAKPAAPPVASIAQPAPPSVIIAAAPAPAPLMAKAGARSDEATAQSHLAAPEASVRVQGAGAGALLQAALIQADAGAVRRALDAGASVHERDAEGRTPLMRAARAGASAVVEVLLAAGARKTDQDPQGRVAADHALEQQHPELAARLR